MGCNEIIITVYTHVIGWDALKPELLSKKAKDVIKIANQTDGIIFCEISLWRIAMLRQKYRIKIEVSYLEL